MEKSRQVQDQKTKEETPTTNMLEIESVVESLGAVDISNKEKHREGGSKTEGVKFTLGLSGTQKRKKWSRKKLVQKKDKETLATKVGEPCKR